MFSSVLGLYRLSLSSLPHESSLSAVLHTLTHTHTHSTHCHTCDDFRLLTFVFSTLPRRSPGLRLGSISLARIEPTVAFNSLSPVVLGAPSLSIDVGAIDARLEAALSPPTNDARPPPTVERRADA